ncbi:hypothetical protein [Deefgea piscis]|uniref:hypothetical protein n=1 Tax=Deefgea piscis TaxID=2739061 RepID=UPI001C8050AC|nr:hypothetical protein [Deefgea piscis]QZA80093.1 hypothetical protein K4H25_11135 [Deefgea piscis]
MMVYWHGMSNTRVMQQAFGRDAQAQKQSSLAGMVAVFIALLASPCWASDADALSLADQASEPAVARSDWQIFTEGMLGHVNQRAPLDDIRIGRASVDVLLDTAINPEWRFTLANRVDWLGQGGQDEVVNTFKEGYVSWQASPNAALDLGRVNLRSGVALGYNPTDYFKVGALRSVVSIAPSSLRENRLGVGMLRGQWVWEGGAVNAVFAPKLADQRQSAAFSPDWGASNSVSRYLLTSSVQLLPGFAPQVLLLGEQGQSPQVGMNASILAGDALTLYAEYSGGRSATLLPAAPVTWHSRLAAGGTYTFANNLSLSLEYHYDGAALNQSQWRDLWRNPADYWAYRSAVFNAQSLPTQQAAMSFITWRDAGLKALDLNWMLRRDLVDQSWQSWLEARYHFERMDWALQWQYQNGAPGSQYGALPQRHSVQAVVKYFF